MSRTAYWIGALLALLGEIASLAALAAAGWSAAGPGVLRVLLAVGLPLAAAVLWGLFAAPRAVVRHAVLAAATKVLVQGGAAVALVVLGLPLAAAALVAAVLLGLLLTARPPAGVAPAR